MINKLLGTLYFTLLFLSCLIFWKRSYPYVRPMEYFIFLSFVGVVIFVQIMLLWSCSNKLLLLIIFLEIFFLSVAFNLTQQMLYKTVTGRDPWEHWLLTQTILQDGHVPPFNLVHSPYVKLPEFHLLVATYMLLSGIPYKWASYIIIGVGSLLLELLVLYLLTKTLFDKHVALLAMLFMATSDVVLYMTGRNIVPNTVGLALVFLLLYIFLSETFICSLKTKIIVAILVWSLAFMHTVSYAFAIVQLVLLVLASLATKRNITGPNVLWLISQFILAIFVWAFVSGIYFKGLVLRIYWLLFGMTRGVSHYFSSLVVPFMLVLLARSGMLLLFGFSGLGILVFMFKNYNRHYVSRYHLDIILVSSFFIILGLLAPFIPSFLGINERVWYYGEILGSMYIGYLLYVMWNLKTRFPLFKLLSLCIVFFMLFLMLTSPMSNDDNPLIKSYSPRTGWYDSELVAAKFVVLFSNSSVATDIDFQHFASVEVGMLNESLRPIPLCNLKTFEDMLKHNKCLDVLRVALIRSRYFVLGVGYSQRAYLPLGNKTKEVVSRFSIHKDIIYTTKTVVIFD